MKLTYLNEYHFFNETIMPEAPTVLQVGLMGIGALRNLRMKYPDADILAYEADEDNVQAMIDDADELSIPIVQEALASKNGKVTLYKYKCQVSHSIFPRHEITPNNPELKLMGEKKVEGSTLMQIVKDHEYDYLDLLIMNCEGAEMFALKEIIKKKTLRNKIGQICVSFHAPRIYTNEEKDAVIAGLLETHHHFVGKKCPSTPDHLFIRKV